MEYVKVPLSRLGAIIGPKGDTKKRIEELSGCKINIDSDEGIIEMKIKGLINKGGKNYIYGDTKEEQDTIISENKVKSNINRVTSKLYGPLSEG